MSESKYLMSESKYLMMKIVEHNFEVPSKTSENIFLLQIV